MEKTGTSRSEKIAVLVMFLLFVGLNVLLFCLSNENASMVVDSRSYLEPAKLLVAEGVYRSQMRLPAYPVFLSFFVRFFDQPVPYVIWVQVAMVFCTALCAMKVSRYLIGRFSLAVLFLTAFNSNALLHAHKILPDTFFSLLFAVFILLLVQSYVGRSLWRGILCGVVAGLTALTRGNGAHLIILMPLVMVVGWRVMHRKIGAECIRLCILSCGVTVLVIVPWLLHNRSQKGVLKINSVEYVNFAIHENLMRIEYLGLGLSKRQAAEAVKAKALQEAGIDPKHWEGKPYEETHQLVKDNAAGILLSHSPKVLFYAGIRSLAYFFLDPGYKDFTGHIKIGALHLDKDKLGAGLSIRSFFRQLFFSPEPATKVYAFFVVVLLLLRLAAFFGLIASVFYRDWQFLVLCGGFVLYFAFIAGLIGYARYRLPVGPLLNISAVYGIMVLAKIFKRRAVTTGS